MPIGAADVAGVGGGVWQIGSCGKSPVGGSSGGVACL